MRSLFVSLLVLAPAAFAQEIGTEVAPVTPVAAPHRAPLVESGKATASSGAFGVRAGFGTSVAALPAGTAAATLTASTVGASLFVGDSLKLNFDLGLGLIINTRSSSGGAWAFGVGAGIDYLFRTSADALRPLLYGGVSFSIAGAGSTEPVAGVTVQLGGGAEYFFSPNFALYGRLGLALAMAAPGGYFQLGLFTLTPGVGATFYF
jgi:hypothetical protein